jgi:hypothetical protein
MQWNVSKSDGFYDPITSINVLSIKIVFRLKLQNSPNASSVLSIPGPLDGGAVRHRAASFVPPLRQPKLGHFKISNPKQFNCAFITTCPLKQTLFEPRCKLNCLRRPAVASL